MPPRPGDGHQAPHRTTIATCTVIGGDLQKAILPRPLAGDLIQGSGGVLKLRFSPERLGKGKSGAYRVFYIPFLDVGVIYLLALLPKSESANLPKAQVNALRVLVKAVRKQFDKE